MFRLSYLIFLAVLIPGVLAAQSNADTTGVPSAPPQAELPSALRGLKIGTKTYISYQYIEVDDGTEDAADISRFQLKRGYIDIRKTITDYFSFRITPDVHQDGTGDWKVRLKYLHARFTASGNDVIGKPYAEVGIAHMPWLDFEEHINLFRMQGTMFMERNRLFNSADLGVMVGANIGSELPAEFRNNVNSSYAGRWGSFQLGVFNGGGYHARALNRSMVFEGRLTIRPLPDVAPGFQISGFGLTGKGNTPEEPDWNVLTGMVSYESVYFNATGQYYNGAGSQRGLAVDSSGISHDQDGYSAFAEVRMPGHRQYSAFGRYDRFNRDRPVEPSYHTKRFILGLAWQFIKGNYWVISYDRVENSLPDVPTVYNLEVTLQMVY